MGYFERKFAENEIGLPTHIWPIFYEIHRFYENSIQKIITYNIDLTGKGNQIIPETEKHKNLLLLLFSKFPYQMKKQKY